MVDHLCVRPFLFWLRVFVYVVDLFWLAYFRRNFASGSPHDMRLIRIRKHWVIFKAMYRCAWFRCCRHTFLMHNDLGIDFFLSHYFCLVENWRSEVWNSRWTYVRCNPNKYNRSWNVMSRPRETLCTTIQYDGMHLKLGQAILRLESLPIDEHYWKKTEWFIYILL